MGSMVEIAVGRPVGNLYTYLLPPSLGPVAPGQRVLVPFGSGKALGFIVRQATCSPREDLREVTEILDPHPVFSPELLALLQWAASYYRHPLGEVFRCALPPGLSGSKRSPTRRKNPKNKTKQAPEFRSETIPVLTFEQAQAVEVVKEACLQNSFKPFLLHGVTGSGKTEVYMRIIDSVLGSGKGALVLVPEIALTPQLVGRFKSRFASQVAILHSGMRSAERTQEWERLQRGDAVLAIGVRSAIFAPVCKLGIVVVDEEHDSSFKQEEKFRYHARDLAVVRGQQTGCPVVLGSATPSLESLQNVRLGRYRLLQLLQRVDNRPMPVVRMVDMRLTTSQHIDAAFPQLAAKIKLRAAESAVNYQAASLVSPATVDPILEPTYPASVLASEESSLKIQSDESTLSSPLISVELAQAIEKVLHKGKQAILFLNRRGQSTYHFCLACGQTLSCKRCAVSLTWHRSLGSLLCHYCGYREPLPQWCPSCAGPIESLGMGTERVEAELQKVFPQARIARLDRDSATRADQIETLLARFGRGEQDILVGTQMVAKGHDFPGVTLVGVLLADASLNLPDFRAAERTFQLLAQVAGRAGRGQEAGEVIVQTFNPQADAVACVVGHDYSTFAEREMKLRKAYYYPPFCRLLAVRIDSKSPQQTGEAAVKLVQMVAPLLKKSSGKLRLLGPAPAPISRLKGKTRWQFLVKGPTSRSLVPVAQVLEEVSRTFSRTIKISVDVDPLSLL